MKEENEMARTIQFVWDVTLSDDSYLDHYKLPVIKRIVCYYLGGMSINDIASITVESPLIVNTILDHIIPYF